MRTRDEIESQIAKLQAIKPKIPQMTGFGEDNHEAIDIQIRVLDDRMDNDAIYDEFDGDDHRLNAARDACEWLHDDGPDMVDGEGWASVVRE